MNWFCRCAFVVSLTVLLVACGSDRAGQSPIADGESPGDRSLPAGEQSRRVELSDEALAQLQLVTEVAEERRIPRVLRTSGRVTMNDNRTWRVGAVTDGRVVEINRNVGETVREGDLLARMFSHEIHEARAEYARAKSELARLASRRTYLQTLRDRFSRLHEMKAASLQQVQQAESELQDHEGEIRNAETELERTRFHLEEYLAVQLETDGMIRVAGFPEGDLLPIRAPASGMVVERTVTPGTVVQPASDLFVISDLQNVWMIAAVQQQDLSLVRMGMPVAVDVQAYPETKFSGRVGWIGSELDAATRTVSVRVELPNTGLRLRPEMYATAEIALDDSDSGIFVRQEALQELHGQAVVFLELSPGNYAVQPVDTGQATGAQRRILAGLRGGERVVVEGSFLLKSKLLEASLVE